MCTQLPPDFQRSLQCNKQQFLHLSLCLTLYQVLVLESGGRGGGAGPHGPLAPVEPAWANPGLGTKEDDSTMAGIPRALSV